MTEPNLFEMVWVKYRDKMTLSEYFRKQIKYYTEIEYYNYHN
jgi:hypothetical protein